MFGELSDVMLIDYMSQKGIYMQEVPRCACAGPIDELQRENWRNNTFAVDPYDSFKAAKLEKVARFAFGENDTYYTAHPKDEEERVRWITLLACPKETLRGGRR